MILHDDDGAVRTLTLAHGKASALDIELLGAIERAIADLEACDARAGILTGTGGIFSAGVDLKRLVDGGDDYLDAFLPALDRAFRAAFFCSKPLVVACNGHAIAGGCVLLCCGDVRLGAAGRGRVGVPELRVGVPFPRAALELVRFVVPPQHAQSVLLEGETYDMEAARRLGLLDRIVDPEELGAEARRVADRLAQVPPEAIAETKALLREPVRERLDRASAADAARMRGLWGSDAVRAAVSEYVRETLG